MKRYMVVQWNDVSLEFRGAVCRITRGIIELEEDEDALYVCETERCRVVESYATEDEALAAINEWAEA